MDLERHVLLRVVKEHQNWLEKICFFVSGLNTNATIWLSNFPIFQIPQGAKLK